MGLCPRTRAPVFPPVSPTHALDTNAAPIMLRQQHSTSHGNEACQRLVQVQTISFALIAGPDRKSKWLQGQGAQSIASYCLR